MKKTCYCSLIICIFIAKAFCSDFYLYNIAKYKDEKQNEEPYRSKFTWDLIFTLPGIKDSLENFKKYKIPYKIVQKHITIKPGKKVRLLKNSKFVGVDKISHFYVKSNEGNGNLFLYFNLQNHNLTKDVNEYLIINLPDTIKYKDDIREIQLSKLSIHEQDVLLGKLTKYFLKNIENGPDSATRHHLPYEGFLKSIVDTIKNDLHNMKKQISENYYIEHYASTSKKNKLTILQFMSLKFLKEHFTVILNDANIYILPHSMFKQTFIIADEVYFTCEGYTPHTGAAGLILYKVQNTNIIRIQSDYSFAD